MSDQNKAVLRRHFAEVWSEGNVALVDALFASDCLSHAPPDKIEGVRACSTMCPRSARRFRTSRSPLRTRLPKGTEWWPAGQPAVPTQARSRTFPPPASREV
jgi:hypothetical protein